MTMRAITTKCKYALISKESINNSVHWLIPRRTLCLICSIFEMSIAVMGILYYRFTRDMDGLLQGEMVACRGGGRGGCKWIYLLRKYRYSHSIFLLPVYITKRIYSRIFLKVLWALKGGVLNTSWVPWNRQK